MEYNNDQFQHLIETTTVDADIYDLVDELSKYSSAWAQEVAELEKDKEELRELCRLLNRHANKFDFEGAGSEDEKRVHELWAQHITRAGRR